MQLIVDGTVVASNTAVKTATVYSGFWNIGGHQNAWVGAPTSKFLAGTIDNVAVYGTVLPAERVTAHYTAGIGKPNVGPAAAYSSSAKDLTASFDASGSSDPDGSIVSYVWDFGDGSTATGKTTTHTFAKAGSYTVKLTVADNRGATNVVSKSVSVTDPVKPDPGALAADTFDRAVSSGWGTAPTGGAWRQSGNAGGASVANGVGVLLNSKGETRKLMIPGVSASSTDSTVSFTVDSAPTGGGQFTSVIGRQIGADSYSARAWVQSNGVLQLQLRQGETTLKAVNLSGMTYTVGQKVFVRVAVTGSGTTTLNAKAWTTGAEPAAWQLTATDTTASLQAPGSVGLSAYVSGTATADVVFSLDDYRVVSMG
jgi:PKD repeat protein